MHLKSLDDLKAANYEVGGRGPDSYDCLGLAFEVRRRLGIVDEIVTTPDEDSWYEALMSSKPFYTKLDSPKFGCFVLLRNIHALPIHIGVVLEYPQFIHIRKGITARIENLNHIIWKTKIEGFYT